MTKYFKRYFIYLKSTFTEKGRNKMRDGDLSSLIYSSCNNDKSWVRLKPGARNFFQIFYVGIRPQRLEPFPGTLAEPDCKWKSRVSKPEPIRDVWHCNL